MADETPSHIQDCPSCATQVDVSGEEPCTDFQCPGCGTAMRVQRRFDHFELLEQLGVGGMGTVYRALDRNLGRHVALKLLQREHSQNPEFNEQFAREAAITASINHPYVVKVFSTGRDHGRVYIAMELVGHGSLDELLEKERKLPEEEVLATGIQIAQGLNAALQRGLIHRDIKPGNILFADRHTAKIVDFGLAVLMENAGTVMGEVWGTPSYVAPEKLDNQPEDVRSDIYSLGAALFHALAGAPPCNLDSNQMSELLEVKRKLPSLAAVNREVSEATAFAIDKALKFAPADRFQTYGEMIKALEYAQRELAATRDRRAKGVKRKPQTLMLTGAALAVLVGLAVTFWPRHSAPPVNPEEEVVTTGSGSGADRKYQAARMLLAGSDATKAAAAFRSLEKLPDVPQPRLNWISTHAGLAEFLGGRSEEGRAEFAKIAERGPFSTDPTEQRLAEFFVAMAKLAAAESAVKPATIEALKPEGEECIVLLVCGMKNWALKDYENAAALLAQFGTAAVALPAKSAWVGEYKALAAPIVADFTACTAASEEAAAAVTLADYEKALASVEAARAKLRHPAALGARLEPLASDLRMKIVMAKSGEAARLAALAEADQKVLAELKPKLLGLCGLMRYNDALITAKATSVHTESAKKVLASMVLKTEWLARFKATLINDIATVGYPDPLVKRPNQIIPGGVRRANEIQVEVVSQFGSVPVPWTEVSRDSIIAMGVSFLRQARTTDKVADRQWLLGVYALYEGKDTEGRDLLIQAARGKDDYRQMLGYFTGIAESL
ncbi:MAG: serine/threonine protein kinase [Chthoniobacter sp.]|nr:serine/threonine protein kinase [Chthoniobacter sp.]